VQINLNKLCHFEIPRLTPSNNVLLRMHHMDRAKLNNTWHWEVKAAINDFEHSRGEIPVSGKDKRGVKIVSYRKQKMDTDNFYGGLKPILDALVCHYLIWDDGPKFIELKAEIRIDLDNPRTVIEISI